MARLTLWVYLFLANISFAALKKDMVTSQKMKETEMGYRGSKSKFINFSFVKEQRVDGSYLGSITVPKLRYTLMGGESRYQTKIPSNRFVISSLLSTFALDSKNQACLAAIPYL